MNSILIENPFSINNDPHHYPSVSKGVAKLETLSENNGPELLRQRKRSRVEIYRDVLIALQMEESLSHRPSMTRVASKVNMPYDRFIKVLETLADIGFCSRVGKGFKLADKGAKFLQEYSRFSDSLNKMGLVF